ncbi:Uncharacterised protein [Serratia quinivorans]|uniref:hypothetical protein n=1 Tax=Serratia quinivorans TaxID=137545 RepID=UPI00217B888D|nr:hypothetical protein [Serratia quinivorans]CAI2056938.1 Uncharacterised protein [Serratia quinivorans]
MSNRRLQDTSFSPDSGTRDAESGGVSSKLLEQLNSERLDLISEEMAKLANPKVTTENAPAGQGGNMSVSFQSFIKGAGLSLPLIIAVAAAATWVNSTIDSKTRENRIEMKADLETVKTDLKAEAVRTQDEIKRLDDKIDRKLDKISDQLGAIHQELREHKN